MSETSLSLNILKFFYNQSKQDKETWITLFRFVLRSAKDKRKICLTLCWRSTKRIHSNWKQTSSELSKHLLSKRPAEQQVKYIFSHQVNS
jgi:hypothetical protein